MESTDSTTPSLAFADEDIAGPILDEIARGLCPACSQGCHTYGNCPLWKVVKDKARSPLVLMIKARCELIQKGRGKINPDSLNRRLAEIDRTLLALTSEESVRAVLAGIQPKEVGAEGADLHEVTQELNELREEMSTQSANLLRVEGQLSQAQRRLSRRDTTIENQAKDLEKAVDDRRGYRREARAATRELEQALARLVEAETLIAEHQTEITDLSTRLEESL